MSDLEYYVGGFFLWLFFVFLFVKFMQFTHRTDEEIEHMGMYNKDMFDEEVR